MRGSGTPRCRSRSALVGTVAVDGEAIGTLRCQFKVDPGARASDHRLLLAAAEKHLRAELARRAARCLQAARTRRSNWS